jgi:hypothetical protein
MNNVVKQDGSRVLCLTQGTFGAIFGTGTGTGTGTGPCMPITEAHDPPFLAGQPTLVGP